MKALKIDPFLTEVIRNQMISVISEMTDTLIKASYTPTIYEVKDFSIAIHNCKGDVVAQGVGIPIFLGSMSTCVKETIDKIGIDNFQEDDVIISNDPFLAGGTHVNDINIIQPFFFKGKLIAFLNCKAHWRDIGGKDPGSWASDATNIYQEGLRLPPLKIVNKGIWNDELLNTILANNRLVENALGDLKAQVASCYIGNIRMWELVKQYGISTFSRYMEEIINHGERLMRAEISEIPNGTYYSEGYVDSDGISEKPVKISLKLIVQDDEIIADLSGSDTQQKGSAGNTIYAGTLSAVRLAVKTLTDPNLPTNEGCYLPIKVITKKGTCVDAQWPSAVTVGLGNVNLVTIECVYSCFGGVLQNRIIGQIYGGINALQIAGNYDDTDEIFVFGAPHSGGWGARSNKDGISGMMTIINGDCRNIPTEIIETKYPLFIEEFSLIKNSGGAGKYRGGLGIRTDYKVLAKESMFTSGLVKYAVSPKGVFDGKEAMKNKTILNPDTDNEEVFTRVSGKSINKYDVVSHQMGGGGGYGNPLERDLNAVLSDVLNEYISTEVAIKDYGVVIENGQINKVATNKIRKQEETF